MNEKIVTDVWANWWPESFFEDYPPMWALYDRFSLQGRAALTIDDLIAEADAGGVNKILLSATAFPGSRMSNGAVADVIDKFIALKLLPFLYDKPPNDAIYFPLYAACIDLGIPVLILTGHTAVQRPNITGRPEYLDDVALHFPELTIVAGHAGYPWTNELIALAWKHPNLYIDTSGHRPRHFSQELLRFLNSYGREKVLFGTGYPMMDYTGPLAEASALDLKPGVLKQFLGGNAARVIPGFAS